MPERLSENYEQLTLDTIVETAQDTQKNQIDEKIYGVLSRFLPGVEIFYDTYNDEIVLR